MAVGTPGAQVVSIKRLSPTDSDLLVTTSYPELTDAVVCRVFTLKHKWSEKNGRRRGPRERRDGLGLPRSTGPGRGRRRATTTFVDYRRVRARHARGCYAGAWAARSRPTRSVDGRSTQ